jgi:squalene-hopene/tetraprenyl-beta-curcumene cyclase
VAARRTAVESDRTEATGGDALLDDARQALARARERLLSLQHEDGHWRGLLETNVTMDAEDLLLREFLGVRDDERLRRTAAHIRSSQAPDGSWANYAGGPGDLSTTIEAYWALKLAGDDPGAEHMRRASAFARARGGPRAARVFTHVWMALFGLWPWEEIPALPPELMFLPRWFPLNRYDFACWARQTVVALTIVRSHRPVRPLGLTLDELGPGPPAAPVRARTLPGRVLVLADRLLRAYERRPIAPLRRLALGAAERWTLARQEADGGWGGIQPPWVYSLIALRLQGYPLEHPAIRAGLEGLEGFTVHEPDGSCWLEACQSPVWDTALALLALSDAGLPADDGALVRAADWLLERQVTDVRGDWAVRRPTLRPGGWAFEYHNVNYPDVDDTAVVALALRRAAHPNGRRLAEAIARGVEWTVGMQSSDGGWGAFDADNCRALAREIPFLDFGEVIDPPSADVTAHAVELLAAELAERSRAACAQPEMPGRASVDGAARAPAAAAGIPVERVRAAAAAGLRWLLDAQEADGSWFGRWGVNHVYGTWSALCALIPAGIPRSDERVQRAVRWLYEHQNDDGGWGEDCRSYEDPAWIGRGSSTASQTAWALLGLHAAGEASSPGFARGVRWLLSRQREDGGWDEDRHTGTGFPGDFYINYHLYRLLFPVMALGRAVRSWEGR